MLRVRIASRAPPLLNVRPAPGHAVRARPRRLSTAMAATPPEKPVGLEAAAKLFRELADVPSFPRGVLFGAGAGLQLLLTTAQRDLESNNQRTCVQTLPVGVPAPAPAFGFELRGAALMAPSPSGRRMLVVRNGASATDPVLLELWGGGRLLREVEVPASVHGAVYTENWFESAAWNAAEDRVCYVAESPAAVRTPLWAGRTKAGADAATAGWRGLGEHVEDWGEQLTGKRCAALFVLACSTGEVLPVAGTPPDSSCGQVVWAPGDGVLVFTAWRHKSANFNTPRRLGAVYCFNRPCALYSVRAPGGDGEPAVCLTRGLQSAFSPRFSPSGASLAFASSDAACTSGAHNAAVALHVMSWDGASESASSEARCALPVVASPAAAGDFPGWYTAAPLARMPWVSDTQLVLCTTWGSADALVLVDVTSGAVRRITPPLAESGHWALLDVRDGMCAASVSTPTAPPCLAVASAPDWAWRRVEPAAPEPFSPGVQASLAALEWRVVDVPLPGRPAGSAAEVEAILLRSKPSPLSAPPPVVLVPHGGPHSACVAGFVTTLAFLAAHGYAVLQVNYRGSIGSGQASLESLLGRAGRQDVDDCLAALDAAAAAGLVDAKRAAVVGGSHGGFLAAHLIGQAPDRFACAALRNPVTDVASMVGITDIPDWCFVEAGGLGPKAYDEVVTPAALSAMRAMSPMAHVDAVRTPVLMLLGAKDRRVPPSNGMAYAHALRQRGVTVRTFVFPEDEHGLTKPRTEMESFLNVLDFLQMYVPK